MTTWLFTAGRESILTLLGKQLGRLGRRLAAPRAKAALRLVFRFLLVAAGLGLLSTAAWLVALPLGLAAAGLSCLVLEWAVKR